MSRVFVSMHTPVPKVKRPRSPDDGSAALQALSYAASKEKRLRTGDAEPISFDLSIGKSLDPHALTTLLTDDLLPIGTRQAGPDDAPLSDAYIRQISSDRSKPQYIIFKKRRIGPHHHSGGPKQLGVFRMCSALLEPPPPDEAALIDIYMSYSNPAFPLVYLPPDERQVDMPFHSKLCLTALNHCRPYRSSRNAIRNILLASEHVAELEPTRLSTISSALLELSARPVLDVEANYMLLARTIAAAQLLGLHIDSATWAIPPWEKELRQCLWWALRIHDAWYSFSALSYNQTTPLPDSLIYIVSPAGSTLGSDSGRSAQSFIMLCRLSVLCSRLQSQVCTLASSMLGPSERLAKVKALEDDTQKLLAEVRRDEIGRSTSSGVASLMTCLLGFRCMLRRISIELSIGLGSPFTPDPATLEMYAEAVDYICNLDGRAFDGYWLNYVGHILSSLTSSLIRLSLATSAQVATLTPQRTTVTIQASSRTMPLMMLSRLQRALQVAQTLHWDLADAALNRAESVVNCLQPSTEYTNIISALEGKYEHDFPRHPGSGSVNQTKNNGHGVPDPGTIDNYGWNIDLNAFGLDWSGADAGLTGMWAGPPQEAHIFRILLFNALDAADQLYDHDKIHVYDSYALPNKPQLIAEWLLTRLLKERKNPPLCNPIVDIQYWELLVHIFSQQGSQKHWLLPLLNRVPVAPIVASLFELCRSLDVDRRDSLASVANRSFMRFWPLAVPKIPAEMLLECLGAFLGVNGVNDGLQQMGFSIISSLRYAVGNSSNRKKLFTLFIRNHLHDWIVSLNNSASSAAQETLYSVGVDILFNLETLRQVHDDNHPLVVALRSIPQDLAHPVLPRLYASFVVYTKKHRGALFGQTSGHTSSAVTDRVRSAAFTFLDSCQGLLSVPNPQVSTWLARTALLEVVRDEHLFSSIHLDGQMSLQSVLPLVLSTLTADYVGKFLNCPQYASHSAIDHDLIMKDVPRILPALLLISEPLPSILSFLEMLLEYHIKTRTMQTHIETLFASLAPHSSAPTTSTSVQQEYHGCSSGAYFHPTHLGRLSKATETFLTPSQVAPTVEFILAHLQSLWKQMASSKPFEDGRLVVSFSFSAQLAAVILTALPLRSLSESNRRDVQDTVSRLKDGFLTSAISKSVKTVRKDVGSWEAQISSAALLRLAYSLDLSYTERLWDKAQAVLGDRVLDSELSMELFRLLLKWSHVADISSARGLFDEILKHLEGSCDLTILTMLIERWLPTIDALAFGPQLERLVKIIFKTPLTTASLGQGANATTLLLNALSSAEFWELPPAILAFADESTTSLTDLGPTMRKDKASSIYGLLLLFPVEYLSRTVRTDLAQRAMDTDVSFTGDIRHSAPELRAFIHNVALYRGSIDQPPSSLLKYLMHLVHGSEHTAMTLSLIESHFLGLLMSSDTASADAIVDLFKSFPLSNVVHSPAGSTILSHLIHTLSTTSSLLQLASNVREELQELYQRLAVILVAHIQQTKTKYPDQTLLKVWLHARLLGRWLNLTDKLPLLGRTLCFSNLPLDDGRNERCSAAFAILTQELRSSAHPLHLGSILAAYISFGRILGRPGRERLDRLVAQTCKDLQSTDFSSILQIVGECLSDVQASVDDMPNLVRFSSLLLSSHPGGTSKATQRFFTICVGLFSGRSEFTSGPLALRLEVSSLLRQHCSESPASLRVLDMGNIWLLLSKLLARSKQRDTTTSPAINILQDITSVIGAVIRLRRDLVALTLPNLSFVLQQVVSTIRRPRSQLGGKQTALVADALPQWIDPATPVSVEDVKSISRLLEALPTKTTIRTHSEGIQKAESLARPFSKHAIHVLKAYIDAMNDPLCLLPSDLRRELRPGLFALCSIINEHSRDAMMSSALDSGGKTIMKNLWAEYEKQKYIGKG
ncbi:Urb2/Npa2 family-domain-containing protein [Mycena amicta]|nr:Urb2/Npa2 family-domain-containing protein [Mycena amicta]